MVSLELILVTDKLSLNVALNGYNMSWAPKHGILTEYKSNGLDMLPFLTTSDKEFEFVDNLTIIEVRSTMRVNLHKTLSLIIRLVVSV